MIILHWLEKQCIANDCPFHDIPADSGLEVRGIYPLKHQFFLGVPSTPWVAPTETSGPLQNDSYNCGIFVLCAVSVELEFPGMVDHHSKYGPRFDMDRIRGGFHQMASRGMRSELGTRTLTVQELRTLDPRESVNATALNYLCNHLTYSSPNKLQVKLISSDSIARIQKDIFNSCGILDLDQVLHHTLGLQVGSYDEECPDTKVPCHTMNIGCNVEQRAHLRSLHGASWVVWAGNTKTEKDALGSLLTHLRDKVTGQFFETSKKCITDHFKPLNRDKWPVPTPFSAWSQVCIMLCHLLDVHLTTTIASTGMLPCAYERNSSKYTLLWSASSHYGLNQKYLSMNQDTSATSHTLELTWQRPSVQGTWMTS